MAASWPKADASASAQTGHLAYFIPVGSVYNPARTRDFQIRSAMIGLTAQRQSSQRTELQRPGAESGKRAQREKGACASGETILHEMSANIAALI